MRLPAFKHPLARRGLLAGLALTAAIGVVAGREKPTLERFEPAPARSQAAAVAAAPDIDLEKLKRGASGATGSDPFAPRSFAPPAPVRRAAAAPVEAAPPSAPPLPFVYAGKLVQDGRTEIFVLRGEELISIAPGQSIDAEYRVDAIGESQIAFTYLPLKMRQSLELEESGG